jgi:hypothetical protein
MEMVQQIDPVAMPGQDKKSTVLSILRNLVATEGVKSKVGGEAQDALLDFVDNVLPDLIDAIVSAARGQFDIAKVAEATADVTQFACDRCVPLCCAEQAWWPAQWAKLKALFAKSQ